MMSISPGSGVCVWYITEINYNGAAICSMRLHNRGGGGGLPHRGLHSSRKKIFVEKFTKKDDHHNHSVHDCAHTKPLSVTFNLLLNFLQKRRNRG